MNHCTDLDQAIRSRRSVRRFHKDPVPLELIHEILDLARYCPSSMNGQPWHFVVVEDPNTKRALAVTKHRYCPVEKKEFKATVLEDAPVVIAVCVDRLISYQRETENGILATSHILMAAHSRGLGSVYLSAYRNDEPRLAQEIRKILRLPDNLEPITLLPMGYADEVPAPKEMTPLRVTVLRAAKENSANCEFEKFLDRAHSQSSSIVLRFLRAFETLGHDFEEFASLLGRSSIREGIRCFYLMNYRGVEIHVLDETSAMHTGTFKALDGCVTAAHCLQRGYRRVVFESGGNTASALSSYCGNVGIETYAFVPASNIGLLHSSFFADAKSHLIAVQDRQRVKEVAKCFAQQLSLPLVPAREWRFDATRIRGHMILELLLERKPFDWFVQTISAAFGPIGIYRALAKYARELNAIPHFLGVQQKANCPMFKAWQNKRKKASFVISREPDLLIPVMYDANPMTHHTFDDLVRLMDVFGGCLTTVDRDEFNHFLRRDFERQTIRELLAANGLILAERNGEIIDKAGVLALAGLIKQIDRGEVAPNSRVLCCVSSGTLVCDGKARAETLIDDCAQINHNATNTT